MKKRLLQLTTLTLIATPLVGVVSCFKQINRYDSPNAGSLLLYSPFNYGSTGEKVLNEIVDYYNDKIAEGSSYKVNINNFYESKGKAYKNLDNWIDKMETFIPNIVIDSDNSAGVARKYNMLNNLNVGGDAGVKLSKYGASYLGQNSQLSNNNEKTFIVPLGKSSQTMILNIPVFMYLIEALLNNGAVIDQNSPLLKSILQSYVPTDSMSVKNVWGDYISFLPPLVPVLDDEKRTNISMGKYVISDDIFDNFESLMSFAMFARSLFSASEEINVIGATSPSKLIYNLQHSLSNDDISNFLFDVKGDKLNKKYLNNTKQRTDLRNIYSMIHDALQIKALRFNDNNLQVTNGQKFHRTAFTFTETSDYFDVWTDEIFFSYEYHSVDNEMIDIFSDNKVEMQFGGNIDYTVTHIGEFSNGKIYTDAYDGELALNDIKLTDRNTQTLLSHLSTNPAQTMYISNLNDNERVSNAPSNLFRVPLEYNDYGYINNYLLSGGTEVPTHASLQEDELKVILFNNKFNEDAKETSYINGYSAYAIHRNNVEDAETIKFMKWFTESSTSILGGENFQNPATYFSKKLGLVIPTSDFLATSTSGEQYTKTQLDTAYIMRARNWFESQIHSEIPYISDNIDKQILFVQKELFNNKNTIPFDTFIKNIK